MPSSSKKAGKSKKAGGSKKAGSSKKGGSSKKAAKSATPASLSIEPELDATYCPDGGVLTCPPTDLSTVCQGACEVGPTDQADHAAEARDIRLQAAYCPHRDPRCQSVPPCEICAHPCNGDEAYFYNSRHLPDGSPNVFAGQYPASYTKGLPHDPQTGLGDPDVYCLLLTALATGEPQDFEDVRPLGCEARMLDECRRRGLCEPCTDPPVDPCNPDATPQPPGVPPPQRQLENPQAGLAFELEGADPQALFLPPAPCFASVQAAAEMAELYWMALARDVPYIRYDTDPLIAQAIDDLNNNFFIALSPYHGGPLTPQTVFRGPTAGDKKGPYLSQFLVRDVPYGAQFIPATIQTLLPGIDFMTNWDDWLAVQDGCDASQSNCDPMLRIIRDGRDSAQYVHVDRDFNAFLNACQLLLFGRDPLRRCEARAGLGVPFGPCLPYVNVMAPPAEEFMQSRNPYQGKSQNQLGQGTFGDQHFKAVVVGAAWRAFHAVWFQKWFVHRRLRPEEFGGRVHLRRLYDEGDPLGQPFPVDDLLFASPLFDPGSEYSIFAHNRRQNANRRTPPLDRLCRPSFDGTYLLPQTYAEGSPLHPSYGSGHSTVSGCLATLLKAFFHNDWRFPAPVEPNEDGTSVRLYTGSDAGDLTVAGELDKLASNIGIGRLWAGVHWRSDHEESLLLGEQLAISILCDQRNTFNEPYEYRFRSFDFGPYGGDVIRIRPTQFAWGGPLAECEPCVERLPPDQYDPVLSGAGCERRRRPLSSPETAS